MSGVSAGDLEWIAHLSVGPTVHSLIPDGFEAYALLDVVEHLPGDDPVPRARAVLELLMSVSPGPWLAGFLTTGDPDDDVDAPDTVTLAPGWGYRAVRASAAVVVTLRSPLSARGSIPDFAFPLDRSWLLSHGWDDDFVCFGGSLELASGLVDRAGDESHVLADPLLVPPRGAPLR